MTTQVQETGESTGVPIRLTSDVVFQAWQRSKNEDTTYSTVRKIGTVVNMRMASVGARKGIVWSKRYLYVLVQCIT